MAIRILFKLKIVILFHTVEFLFVASQMLTTNRFEKALYTQEAQWPWVSSTFLYTIHCSQGMCVFESLLLEFPYLQFSPNAFKSFLIMLITSV